MNSEYQNRLPLGLKIIIGMLFLSTIGGVSELLSVPSPRDDISWILIAISIIDTLIALGLILRFRAGYYLFLIMTALGIIMGFMFFSVMVYSLIQDYNVTQIVVIMITLGILLLYIWAYRYFRREPIRKLYLGEI